MVLSILLICLPRNGSIIGYIADDRTNKARFEGHHPSRYVPIMYGPPLDCKGKFGREDKSAQMYSAFKWRWSLLAMMSCARVCPSKSVGCSFETILGTRLRTRRCDCSFVLAAPMQTSVGRLQAGVVAR